MSANRLKVTARIFPDGTPFVVQGRDAWAFLELFNAGTAGCTPIDNPGPRWSAYVHALRHECGLDIGTVHEAHAGPFPGNHARYVLNSPIEIIWRNDQHAMRAA